MFLTPNLLWCMVPASGNPMSMCAVAALMPSNLSLMSWVDMVDASFPLNDLLICCSFSFLQSSRTAKATEEKEVVDGGEDFHTGCYRSSLDSLARAQQLTLSGSRFHSLDLFPDTQVYEKNFLHELLVASSPELCPRPHSN